MRKYLICALCAMLLFVQAATAESLTLYAAHEEGELNIRDEPYGDRIGYLLPGDSGEFVRQEGDWVLLAIGIEAGGGWVNVQYLTTDPEAAGQYVNASGGRLRIRETPGGKAVCWLAAGKTVNVLGVLPDENGDLWGRTQTGYIALKYLEKGEDRDGQKIERQGRTF